MSSWFLIAFVSLPVAVGIVRVVLVGLCLGLPASVVLLPWLLSTRVRQLFASVGPTSIVAVNFCLWVSLLGGIQIGLFGAGIDLLAVEIADPDRLQQLSGLAAGGLALGYALCVFLVIRWRLPVTNHDEHGDGRTTQVLLVGAIVWYHVGVVLFSPYAVDLLSHLRGTL